MAKLTITVTDPATIDLLARYRQFIKDEDGTGGSITEMIEGLVVGCLDDHERFTSWCRRQNKPVANNVAVFRAPKTADDEATTKQEATDSIPARRFA